MSAALPSDEVAEDYKTALDDLVTNDRYQIANLTMIAKENIEHAEAIARVLANHIKRAPPTRKLPALYVLDSLVKNIGSPYTVYFGRNLHETYMLAYSQVDGLIRRKLEEMLKTWREPVPGSLANTPVFPFASTQTIVDSLNRFRASTAPQGQRHQQVQTPSARPQSLQQPYRDTATPPQNAKNNSQSNLQNIQISSTQVTQPQYPQHLLPSQPPVYQYPTAPPSLPSTPIPQATHADIRSLSQKSVDIQQLHANIDDLTTDAKIECATHPMDAVAQKKLQTLQTLKEILDSGNASEQDLIDIRDSIMQQMSKKLSLRQNTQPVATPVHPVTSYANYGPSYMSYQTPSNVQNVPSAATPSFLNSTNLAELLRMTASNGHAPTPTPIVPYHQQYMSGLQAIGTPPVTNSAPVPMMGELPLIAQLRASGLISATPTPPQPAASSAISMSNLMSQVSNSQEVQLNSASIKIARPHLIMNFLNAKPNQCSTCGRRFTADDAGRERKSRHLDWHFKTKARLVEAEKRGQNRSWYVDEREWIASKEYEDDDGALEESGISKGLSPSAAAKKKQGDYVRAPTDPILRAAPCPIDQEPFRSEWSEEVQDFIWKDAIRVGNRYYHASCYWEATKDRDKDGGSGGGTSMTSSAAARIGTPDSVLGKRKAEDDQPGSISKLKIEA